MVTIRFSAGVLMITVLLRAVCPRHSDFVAFQSRSMAEFASDFSG